MANVVKIKRSTTTATPSTLAEGELAFSENSGNLFIGTSGGNIARIGGTSASANVVEDTQDVVGGMVSSNTETGITVTYDDTNGKLNFVVADQAFSQITSKPTTVSGYGITDAYTKTEVNTTLGNYYTKTAADTLLSGKANTATTLAGYGITDATPSSHIGTGGTSHATATTSTAGFMSSSDKTKLDGVATGATANVGTVTSVAMTVPTGLSVSGTPITTSGTLALSLASGYAIPTTAKQTQWDSVYSWYTTMTSSDVNNVIDTVNEIIAAFSTATEGLDVAAQLSAPTSMTLDGGTF